MKSWKCGDALLEYFWVWLGSSFDSLVCSLIHRATWGIWIWFSPIYGVYTAKLFLITAFWTGVLVCPAWYIGNDGCGCALVWLLKILSVKPFAVNMTDEENYWKTSFPVFCFFSCIHFTIQNKRKLTGKLEKSFPIVFLSVMLKENDF